MYLSNYLVFWGEVGETESESGSHWQFLQFSELPPLPLTHLWSKFLLNNTSKAEWVVILSWHNQAHMLEEFEKNILKGSLFSCVVICFWVAWKYLLLTKTFQAIFF